MELRELAEQIVFGTRLEDKLSCPASITDEHPGTALIAPATPSRPEGLQFKTGRSTDHEFPGLHHLERDEERGQLLHFFANHELLATELMALVLLRFPDAPAAFRKGVFQTLKDEQQHTQLYLARMKECGIRFGDLPVSGYFWRSVAPMENPIDYVSGLSLTFEQANLDFCRQFAAGFKAAGDSVTAALLERIYRDEIAHVAYGLKWFRRWKNPSQSDWEAFCHQLKFPLSPNRAKGPILNVEGRRSAGLDRAFIDELNVFSQSKGRTPGVFLFNPFTEGYLAHGPGFTPVKQQSMLRHDLRNLPMFLGRQDDVVLTSSKPSVAFRSRLRQLGFPLPEWMECAGPNSPELLSLAKRKLGRLRPWAWGPDSLEWLSPLAQAVSGEVQPMEERFNSEIAELYSKSWSAALMKQFAEARSSSTYDCLVRPNLIGREVSTRAQAEQVIAAFRAEGHHRLVAKQTFGLAGQSAIRLWEPELLPQQVSWMERAFEQNLRLVIEPWLDRVVDFSLQLEMESSGLRVIGYTGLQNDAKGQFIANRAGPNWKRRFPHEVTQVFREPKRSPQILHEIYADLLSLLEKELLRKGYRGPLGIDAFLFRTAAGEIHLKPMVEINPRYTMGRLTLELMNTVSPGASGEFKIVSAASVHKLGHASFVAFATDLEKEFPIVEQGSPISKIASGAIALADPAETEGYLPIFRVFPSSSER